MINYRLKPLPVDVFEWTGDQATITDCPIWVREIVMGIMPVPGMPLFCLTIEDADDHKAIIIEPSHYLVRVAQKYVSVISPQDFPTRIEAVAETAPTPAPAPVPAPIAGPQQRV